MLQGKVIEDGWRDEGVKETLDLCLACKGCKGDCPVNVDMATYKAEFLSHTGKAGCVRARPTLSVGSISGRKPPRSLPDSSISSRNFRSCADAAKLPRAFRHERTIPAFAPETLGLVQKTQRIIQAKRASSA